MIEVKAEWKVVAIWRHGSGAHVMVHHEVGNQCATFGIGGTSNARQFLENLELGHTIEVTLRKK